MAWTASIVLDPDKSNVGDAVATWNAGLDDEFVYSGRVTMNIADKSAPADLGNVAQSLTSFISSAHNALALRQKTAGAQTAYNDILTKGLNS